MTNMNIFGLDAILNKAIVLPTVSPSDLITNPEKVESDYVKHVMTFIPMGDTTEYTKRLVKKITDGRTPKGLITAPYGYGKTSTLAFLWYESELQGIVAVPPFYCSSLLDILQATYGWVRYKLQYKIPSLLDDLEEIYQKYTTTTLEEMAERHAKQQGIAQKTAVNMLKDMLNDGSLILELTPANLLLFLDAIASLLTRSSYKGLLILPDELQQYLSRGANLRRILQEFREFVWGLKTRANNLGVVFSAPSYSVDVIQENGKDILSRLKEDDLYYRIEDIYTVEFPAKLWERYSSQFKLEGSSSRIFDRFTLKAIGQIAERNDLGEGPRTVIDSFKRAILFFNDHSLPYSPINLIEDFLESNINFQSQTNKIKLITRVAIESTFVDSDEKKQAIKLLAAFPRGCSSEVQEYYHLRADVVQLSKKIHGELIVSLSEGETLLGLNQSGGSTHIVDVIITRFWQTYEEDELHIEAAISSLIKYLIPQHFPVRRGGSLIGWSPIEFLENNEGGYSALIDGSFSQRYPKRVISLQVGYKPEHILPIRLNADLQYEFLFELGPEDCYSRIDFPESNIAHIVINLKQKVGHVLPDDIRKLQEFVLPDYVSPLLLLSLIDYFDKWNDHEEQPILESDRPEIEHLKNRLLGQTIQIIFSKSFADSTIPTLNRVGKYSIEEIFNRICDDLYGQKYSTFFVQVQYESVFLDYINALTTMTLKERRGHVYISGSKETLAKRFGMTSVSNFENRLKNEFSNLIHIKTWSGNQAELQLCLHPLEVVILEELQNSPEKRNSEGILIPVLSSTKISNTAQTLGYKDEETLIALKLLISRGYIRIDPNNRFVYLHHIGPDPIQVKTHIEKLLGEIDVVKEILTPTELGYGDVLSRLLADLDKTALSDDERLDEIQTIYLDIKNKVEEYVSTKKQEIKEQLQSLFTDIDRAVMELRQAGILDREIQGQVAFVMHLNELRQSLAGKRRSILEEYQELKLSLKLIDTNDNSDTKDILAIQSTYLSAREKLGSLKNKQTKHNEQVDQLEKWCKLLQDTDRLFNSLSQVQELKIKLTQDIVPEIQSHLTKRKLEGLEDWETFRLKIKELEDELETRRRHGNEQFTKTKEKYEGILRDMNIGDYRPKCRYTYGEDQESYHDLYEEVRTKVENRISELSVELERQKWDLLKAKFIQKIDADRQVIITEIDKEIRLLEAKIKLLRQSNTVNNVQDIDSGLFQISQEVIEINDSLISIRERLSSILVVEYQLSDEEKHILAFLGNRGDADLTDLFVNMHKSGKDIELKDLLVLLEELFRKNRLIIKIRARG